MRNGFLSESDWIEKNTGRFEMNSTLDSIPDGSKWRWSSYTVDWKLELYTVEKFYRHFPLGSRLFN